MKVYVASYHELYYTDAMHGLIGVYSTLEKAQSAAMESSFEDDEDDAEDFECECDGECTCEDFDQDDTEDFDDEADNECEDREWYAWGEDSFRMHVGEMCYEVTETELDVS